MQSQAGLPSCRQVQMHEPSLNAEVSAAQPDTLTSSCQVCDSCRNVLIWSEAAITHNYLRGKKIVGSYMKLNEVSLSDLMLQCDAPFQMGPEHSHGADLCGDAELVVLQQGWAPWGLI